MAVRVRDGWVLTVLLLCGAGVFLSGINWGLPSRRADPFLFGSRQPWTGEQILQLTASAGEKWDDPSRGADVAGSALAGMTSQRDGPVVVNDTDAKRAQVVRRYRLFSYQPDEMITLMSLARMHPGSGDLDPRLYQYGGLWIYPVGALLKAASLLHLVQLKTGPAGLAFYLDHPEAFGRFYIVARLYAAAWGLVGVWAVFRIVQLLTRETAAAALAALLFCAMPVVVNMAHEAKPHLPGAVLTLLAVLAAAKYARSGRWAHALAAGAICGAAFGMVLSTAPVFGILPLMTLLRRASWGRRLLVTAGAAVVGLSVYAITNPYVVAHQFWQRDVFESNVGNSTAMYRVGRPVEGALNEARLVADGMTAPLAIVGAAGMAALGLRALVKLTDRSEEESARRALGLILAVPAVLVAVQSALIGAGKPGEFGRFMLVPDIFLMIEAVVAMATFLPDRRLARAGQLLSTHAETGAARRAGSLRDSAIEEESGSSRSSGLGVNGADALPAAEAQRSSTTDRFRLLSAVRMLLTTVLLASVGWGGFLYLRAFLDDSQPETSRLREARTLDRMIQSGDYKKLAVAADPAPYCLPPVDLFRWTIFKMPDLPALAAGGNASNVPADLLVRPIDRPAGQSGLLATPITWAAKPFDVRTCGASGAVPVAAK